MEKASGVYLTIKDSSFVTGGTSSLKVLIPMLTTKGEIGLNTVDASTFKDVLGYDLEYNSNYYGLSKILESLSYATVWRLNQNAILDNAYFANKTSAVATLATAESFEDLTKMDPAPLLAVAGSTPGKPQDSAFKITPNATITTKQNSNPISTNPQVIVFDDVSETERSEIDGVSIKSGCVFYNSSDNSIVAAIKDNPGETDDNVVFKVVDGTVTTVQVGTAVWDGEELTITLTGAPSKDSFWNIHTIASANTEWTFSFGENNGDGTYTVQSTVDFSTDTSSDDYWENVDFGDASFFLSSAIPMDWSTIRTWVDLQSGSNGDVVIDPMEMDTTILADAKCNVLAFNGLTDIQVVNRICEHCKENKIHAFVDTPAYSKYIDVSDYIARVTNSEYVAVATRPDQVTGSGNKIYYVYPSVNYVAILASMMSNYGSLNYPPAGRTYGTISVNSLLDGDFERYANELKTDRINWQRIEDNVAVMWEQRTTYARNTDLSYIAPVFIIDEIADQVVSFERDFNFRYSTPTDLLNQESGLKSILGSFVDAGFIYDYELSVPTYAEAQAAGRTLTIKMKVQVMKDAEVIELELEIVNEV